MSSDYRSLDQEQGEYEDDQDREFREFQEYKNKKLRDQGIIVYEDLRIS